MIYVILLTYTACSDDYVLLDARFVLPEFIMHVQLEWSDYVTFKDLRNTKYSDTTCHPALVDQSDEVSSDSGSVDIATRDCVALSGRSQLRKLIGGSHASDALSRLAPYLSHNENYSASIQHGQKSRVLPKESSTTNQLSISHKKQSLLRDLEYVVSSIDVYLKENILMYSNSLKSVRPPFKK